MNLVLEVRAKDYQKTICAPSGRHAYASDQAAHGKHLRDQHVYQEFDFLHADMPCDADPSAIPGQPQPTQEAFGHRLEGIWPASGGTQWLLQASGSQP